MGTFGRYTGPEKISADKIEEFSQAVSKLLYYGGMMYLRHVNIYGKEIMLVEPVTITTGEDVDFYYNFFEDAGWENAGYIYGKQHFYSNKIGSAEFDDVVTAVHCLYELYDEEIGLTVINGEIVQSYGYTGWINHLLGTEFSIQKRFRLWNHAEHHALARKDYDTPFSWGDLMDLLPKNLMRFCGGTELSDLLYIINGTTTLTENEVIPGTYPDDVLSCKKMIRDIIAKLGADESYQAILALVKKTATERRNEKETVMRPLADISLELPARVIIYLTCEQLEKQFWSEWKDLKDNVYYDEMMKKYASDEVGNFRIAGQTRPVVPMSTSVFLRQDGPFTFWDTPEELKDKPRYYVSDADRLYWWDGSDEVRIDENTEQWLADMGEQFQSIMETLSGECDAQEFVKHIIETLYDVEKRYKRVFAFQDMFYEFIANGSKKEYRAAIELLCTLYEDNKESGKIIEKVGDWYIANKSVKCNEGRMCIKRYLSLLANKQLRMKYMNF